MRVLSLDSVRSWELCHADCRVINTTQPAQVCPVCGGDGEGAQVRDPWDGCDPRCGVDADYHGLACWWDCEECNGSGFERVAIYAKRWETGDGIGEGHDWVDVNGYRIYPTSDDRITGFRIYADEPNASFPQEMLVSVVDITASHLAGPVIGPSPKHDTICCQGEQPDTGYPEVHHWEVGAVHLLPQPIQLPDPCTVCGGGNYVGPDIREPGHDKRCPVLLSRVLSTSGLWVLPDSITQQIEQQL